MNTTSTINTTMMCTRSLQHHIQRVYSYNKRADRYIFGSAKNDASAMGGGNGGGGGGAYYDSQSARWITPHDPHFFRLTVNPNDEKKMNTSFQRKKDHLISLSKKYSHFNIPLAMMNKTNVEEDESESVSEREDRNDSGMGIGIGIGIGIGKENSCRSMHEVIMEYARAIKNNDSILVVPSSWMVENEEEESLSSFKFPKNIIFDVVIDASASARKECIQHVLDHFQKGNRVRCTIINFLDAGLVSLQSPSPSPSPWEVGSLAGELCDAGSEEIFLNSDAGGFSGVSGSEDIHVDELVRVMEEICYIDAPGGPMLGRLGLNYTYLPRNNEEFFQEALCDMGVSKLTVEERHLDQCLVDLDRFVPDMSAHDVRIKK